VNALQGNDRSILVIEDDRTLARLIVDTLARVGFATACAHSWGEAREALRRHSPALALLDMRLPDAEGLDCIEELAEHCPVIVLTAYGTIHDAVRAMRKGAVEYLTKPLDADKLELAITRALQVMSLRRSYEFCRAQLHPAIGQIMIGRSPAFQEVLRQVESVADTDRTVLIQGESGVGKELVAQSLHQLSSRASHNFVAVDCSTLQGNLFESELFGHERGAFTGAERRKEGLIEVAEHGTAFFDEIGELPAALQPKMLRLLEANRFRRVGGTVDHKTDARFVAASNRDLAEISKEGHFRRDLYYRLAAFVIHVPPLRARRDDIPLIAEHFLEKRNFLRQTQKHFGAAAIECLVDYPWPGNIRELRNIVERAILVSGSAPEIQPRHLALDRAAAGSGDSEHLLDGEPTLEEVKRMYVAQLVESHKGHRAKIAEILGISERNTYRLLKRYGLSER
jgi:DNA-binding NtrC family response regulator